MPPVDCAEAVAKRPGKTPERDRFDLRIDPEIRARIERQAQRFGQKMTPYVMQAIIERLERDEASDPDPDPDD